MGALKQSVWRSCCHVPASLATCLWGGRSSEAGEGSSPTVAVCNRTVDALRGHPSSPTGGPKYLNKFILNCSLLFVCFPAWWTQALYTTTSQKQIWRTEIIMFTRMMLLSITFSTGCAGKLVWMIWLVQANICLTISWNVVSCGQTYWHLVFEPFQESRHLVR